MVLFHIAFYWPGFRDERPVKSDTPTPSISTKNTLGKDVNQAEKEQASRRNSSRRGEKNKATTVPARGRTEVANEPD
jgi:hypothetical protein